ncbi:hypothetical protein DV738_g5005, partial [Chaetothyriales sp. CBS 135597]
MANQDTETVRVTYLNDVKEIVIITINRPSRRNAVDSATAQKLYDAFRAFEDNDALKVCVFHGSNGTFCAGYDLHTVSKSLQASELPFPPVSGRNIGNMGPSRLQVKKPVIAAVSGHAVAGGLELSLIADLRVVEEDAVFGVFCRRWGVPLIDGGTVRLQAIIGLGRAMDMILTGRPVTAREALSMGLANRVVPKGKAVDEALALAKQLIGFPWLCMSLDRESCYYAAYNATSFEDALSFEFDHGIEAVRKEAGEGAARFSSGAGRHGSFEKL